MTRQSLPYGGLLAMVLAGQMAIAQGTAPGGVTVTAWYRADATATLFSDAGVTPAADNAGVYQWNEYTGTGFNLLQATASARPVRSGTTTLANFNPTVIFDGSNDWMQFNAGTGVNVIDRANGTIYAAGYVNEQKRCGFVGFHPSMDYPGLHAYSGTNNLLFFTGGPGYQGQSTAPMAARSFFTAGTGWQNGAGTNSNYAAATVSLNGTSANYNGSQLNNANLSTGARDFRIGADNNYGAFSGQLNEILVFEERLTAAQQAQVESYLAIKFGTTYAAGLLDYKNSAGATVWTATANAAYNKNIAGLANDGVLQQKQSWSTNTGNQVLIATTGLANTNAANTTGLSAGQYLVWGDNGLAKVPTVSFTTLPGLSHRFAAIWKVQNTGTVGTVRVAWPQGFNSLTLIQSADPTFATGNTATAMTANVVTINGVVYNYADVTLTNGQYFTFGAKLAGPGGVTAGLMMWHKADDGTATAGAKNIWKDMSGNGRDVTQNNNAAYRPALVTNANYAADAKVYSFNFNPFYYFDGTNDFFYREGDLYFPDINSAGSTYGVMMHSNRGGWNTPYGWADDDPNFFRWDERYELWRDNGRALMTTDMDARTLFANIGGMSWRGNGINGVYMNIDGKTYSSTTTHIGTLNNNRTPPNFAIGSEGHNVQASGNEHLQGGISEVFAYSVDHQNSTGDEKLRINSYLAIKYGITLKNEAGTGAANYLSSTSAVVWNATANNGYNNNIAGLASDENSALNQKQSRSNSAGQQVLIGTTSLANTNALNTSSLTNGQYLVWGDNGLGKAPSATLTGVPGVNFRFGAIWKVQNTGTVGTVRVAWPTGLTNLTLVISSDPTFATVTSSHLMTANSTSINGVTYNYADVTLADGQYFTFATQLNGPGGVALDLRVWLRSDAGFTPDQWADLSGNANNYTQTNASRQPFTAAQQYNFNPIVDFGTTGADARFMVVPSGKPYSANGTSSTLFTATISKQSSGFSDIIGFGATTTGTSLTNANVPTFTKSGNSVVLYPYTTAPALPAAAINRLTLDDVSYTVGVSGIKYGKNGQVATTNQTFVAGNALFANGSILGAQPEERDGLIGEVIAYQRDLTDPEKERVRSYVAVKYGLTLSHNYVASNGTTVFWDQASNAGYNNNIASIARDDNGALNQKQSWSVNTAKEVLISTIGLNNDNATNSVMLADQQFLTWGDNGMSKAPAVTFGTISGLPYNRFKAIWKVQNTAGVGTVRVAWAKGYANIKLVQSVDTVFDLSDITTDMNATVLIGGKEYAYADVTLSNGSYFTFAAFVQGPGGVTNNLSQWYRADADVESTGTGTDVTSWADFNGGVISSQIGDAALPKYRTGDSAYFNFNPGINFTATSQKIGNIAVPTLSSTSYNIFSVTKEGMSGSRFFNIGMDNTTFNGTNWDHPGLYPDGGIGSRNNTGGGSVNANPGSFGPLTNAPSIMYYTFTNTTYSKGMNGGASSTPGTYTARGLASGGHMFGANSGAVTSGDDAGFTGNIGELIVYGNDVISAADRNKVDAYLAIKYGVTLSNTVNYVTSTGNIVWDAAANSGFYNNVAGIGNDFRSALVQKQSRSQHANTNNQVIMGLGEIAATNAANTGELTDGQFLVWGDNGNTTAMTNTASTFTAFSYGGGTNNSRRMNRTWKVQNTGVGSPLMVRFPKASVGTTTLPTGDACGNYAIIYASDAAFTSIVAVEALDTTEDGLSYQTMHTFPAGASYFTFGKVTPLNNGVVYLPPVVEQTTTYNTNCNVGEWTHYTKTSDATLKMLGLAGYTTTEMNNFAVTITPEGISYDDGTRVTQVMPRIATVTNNNTGAISTGKVKVYYSPAEQAAATVPGALTNGWFKYNGDADSAMTDIYEDGIFEPGRAVMLTPAASGVENGVSYVEFHNVSSFSSFLYLSSLETPGAVLPVNLLHFTATAQKDRVSLRWSTATEQQSKGFTIERSADSRTWSQVGYLDSKAPSGNSQSQLDYEFSDLQPLNNKSYYRLKQTDIDGHATYSPVRSVVLNLDNNLIALYPNPATNDIRITGISPYTQVVIYDHTGRAVLRTLATHSTETIHVGSLSSGSYIVQVFDSLGTLRTLKLVKSSNR